MDQGTKFKNNKQFMLVMKDLLYKWADSKKTSKKEKAALIEAAEFTEDKINGITKQIAKIERQQKVSEIKARSNDKKRKK